MQVSAGTESDGGRRRPGAATVAAEEERVYERLDGMDMVEVEHEHVSSAAHDEGAVAAADEGGHGEEGQRVGDHDVYRTKQLEASWR